MLLYISIPINALRKNEGNWIHHVWNIRQNETEENVMVTIAAGKTHWKILELEDEGRVRNTTLCRVAKFFPRKHFLVTIHTHTHTATVTSRHRNSENQLTKQSKLSAQRPYLAAPPQTQCTEKVTLSLPRCSSQKYPPKRSTSGAFYIITD